jgi:hypothetical protein
MREICINTSTGIEWFPKFALFIFLQVQKTSSGFGNFKFFVSLRSEVKKKFT